MSRTHAQRKVVFFTSLPRVGGHTTITLGLARILRERFSDVEIWCKPMPEHGHSDGAHRKLESLGCRVVLLASPAGRLRPITLAKTLLASALRPPDLFFTLAMKNLAPILARWTRAKSSIYYHITHDLTPDTIAFLNRCLAAFRKLVFICPATYEEFPASPENRPRTLWIPQLSEIPVRVPSELAMERASQPPGPVKLGLIGRLTAEKGARVMLDFASQTSLPGELHIAGSGPFEGDFRALAESSRHRAFKVIFHGRYDPSERAEFLRSFFRGIDALVVPSQDEWETLSMAVLEALQHGVPSIVCRTGGLRSFEHPDLGPAPQDVIQLVSPENLPSTLENLLQSATPCSTETATRCLNHYQKTFANTPIAKRWLDAIDHPKTNGRFS